MVQTTERQRQEPVDRRARHADAGHRRQQGDQAAGAGAEAAERADLREGASEHHEERATPENSRGLEALVRRPAGEGELLCCCPAAEDCASAASYHCV